MTFNVFLPERGVREVTAFWASTDPVKVDACEVALAAPNVAFFVARRVASRDPYSVTEDETTAMQEAAGDVLAVVLDRLGIHARMRGPVKEVDALSSIARAHLAECAAFNALLDAHKAMPRAAASICSASDPKDGEGRAAGLLKDFAGWAVDEACKAQDEAAKREAEAWARENTGDAAHSGSEMGGGW
jgi:hypothetical protein